MNVGPTATSIVAREGHGADGPQCSWTACLPRPLCVAAATLPRGAAPWRLMALRFERCGHGPRPGRPAGSSCLVDRDKTSVRATIAGLDSQGGHQYRPLESPCLTRLKGSGCSSRTPLAMPSRCRRRDRPGDNQRAGETTSLSSLSPPQVISTSIWPRRPCDAIVFPCCSPPPDPERHWTPHPDHQPVNAHAACGDEHLDRSPTSLETPHSAEGNVARVPQSTPRL